MELAKVGNLNAIKQGSGSRFFQMVRKYLKAPLKTIDHFEKPFTLLDRKQKNSWTQLNIEWSNMTDFGRYKKLTDIFKNVTKIKNKKGQWLTLILPIKMV